MLHLLYKCKQKISTIKCIKFHLEKNESNRHTIKYQFLKQSGGGAFGFGIIHSVSFHRIDNVISTE